MSTLPAPASAVQPARPRPSMVRAMGTLLDAIDRAEPLTPDTTCLRCGYRAAPDPRRIPPLCPHCRAEMRFPLILDTPDEVLIRQVGDFCHAVLPASEMARAFVGEATAELLRRLEGYGPGPDEVRKIPRKSR